MKRTISIKLVTNQTQSELLKKVQHEFNAACNHIVPIVQEYKSFNKVTLHHQAYYPIRSQTKLGSQMTCNVIRAVSEAYKALRLKKDIPIPAIKFKPTSSIHYDKRTYSVIEETLSLYTLDKRVYVSMQLGEFQKNYLSQGEPKEAELVNRKGVWFFNLVLDIPEPAHLESKKVMGVDLGDNNIAATSTGKLFKGGKLGYDRDKYLALRRRLQTNGSQSAKQLLKKVSGKENRHMTHINHIISKEIVQEAMRVGASVIALERLTHIRKRQKVRKKERIRLNRWSFAQLQKFIEYKAKAAGIEVVYVNPAYTSKTCSECGLRGRTRLRHRFRCRCGSQQHADLNASRNICKLVVSADATMCAVNRTHVANSVRL